MSVGANRFWLARGRAVPGALVALWALLATVLMPGVAGAQNTPVGLWRTIDDESGEPRAEIRIRESAGVLSGVIERALVSTGEPNCDLCTDERKGQPKVGMEIIRGARKSDTETVWEQGNILDPEKGKIYRLRLMPLDGGARLQVRGYFGPFYRTQVWIRVQ